MKQSNLSEEHGEWDQSRIYPSCNLARITDTMLVQYLLDNHRFSDMEPFDVYLGSFLSRSTVHPFFQRCSPSSDCHECYICCRPEVHHCSMSNAIFSTHLCFHPRKCPTPDSETISSQPNVLIRLQGRYNEFELRARKAATSTSTVARWPRLPRSPCVDHTVDRTQELLEPTPPVPSP